jgi:hypothetical protein
MEKDQLSLLDILQSDFGDVKGDTTNEENIEEQQKHSVDQFDTFKNKEEENDGDLLNDFSKCKNNMFDETNKHEDIFSSIEFEFQLNNYNIVPTPSQKVINYNPCLQYIIQEYYSIWDYKEREFGRHPGPKPRSLEKEHLYCLNPKNYAIAEKTNGIRYQMFLCYDDKKKPTCVMINRKCELFKINVIAEESFFEGTLFDGELAWEHNSNMSYLIYWIFDVISFKGKITKNEDYLSRLKYAST